MIDSAPAHKAAASPGVTRVWRCLVLAAFGGALGMASVRELVSFGGDSAWPDALLLLCSVVATLTAMAVQLPLINVMLAAVVVAVFSGLAHAVNGVVGFSFGPVEYLPTLGPLWLGVLPPALPLIWVVVILSTRGASRCLLHHSRSHPLHGYRVIGLATALGLVFALGLETLGGGAKGWWTPNSYSWLSLACWGVFELLLQVGVTPLLIDKFPGPRPPNFWPLLVWLGVNGLVVLSLARHGQWKSALVPAGVLLVLAAAGFRAAAPSNAGSTRRG